MIIATLHFYRCKDLPWYKYQAKLNQESCMLFFYLPSLLYDEYIFQTDTIYHVIHCNYITKSVQTFQRKTIK